jgi:hypothetical protein
LPMHFDNCVAKFWLGKMWWPPCNSMTYFLQHFPKFQIIFGKFIFSQNSKNECPDQPSLNAVMYSKMIKSLIIGERLNVVFTMLPFLCRQRVTFCEDYFLSFLFKSILFFLR